MEKLQKPRHSVIDNFRKTFFKSDYGINMPEYTTEQFLDNFKEELETHGFLMDKDHTIGMICHAEGTANQILQNLEDAEGVLIPWEKHVLQLMRDRRIHLVIGEGGIYDIDKLLDCLKVIGWDGVRYYQKGNHKTAMPILFVNSHQEGIVLCPSISGDVPDDDTANTYYKFTEKDLESIRKHVEILQDPNLLEIEILHYSYSERYQVVELDKVSKLGFFNEEFGVQVGDTEWRIDEYNFNKLKEALPDIEITDARTIYEFDAKELTDAITKAWHKRDPFMDEPELFSKCLDDVLERAKYGHSIGASADFFVKKYPHNPPPPIPKHRSLHLPKEWARPIVEAVLNGVFTVDLTMREEGESWYGDDDDPRGSLKLYFHQNDVELPIPSMRIVEAQYKASHLKDFVSDVEFWGSDNAWKNWAILEEVMQFEAEEVRA